MQDKFLSSYQMELSFCLIHLDISPHNIQNISRLEQEETCFIHALSPFPGVARNTACISHSSEQDQ